MHTRKLAAVALLAVAATSIVVVTDGSRALGGPVDAENGSTYDVGTTLAFDVEDGNATYELRTADRVLFAQLRASDGTVVVDTGSLEPGNYVLVHGGTHETVYEFTLAGDGTPTASPTAADSPTATPESVTAEDSATYEVGTRLLFEVANGSYELRTADGALVAQFQTGDGSVVVDTSRLDPGGYRLEVAGSGETAYQFRVTASGSSTGATGSPADVAATPQPTRSATVTVTPPQSESPDGSPNPLGTTTTVPGFGLFAALLAGQVALFSTVRRTW